MLHESKYMMKQGQKRKHMKLNRIAREPYFLVRVFSPFLKELFVLLFVNLQIFAVDGIGLGRIQFLSLSCLLMNQGSCVI